MNRRPRAFTLIELLVVIAICVILLSLSAGVLARVRESGRQVRCLANLRSLHAATEAYRSDNQTLYPFADSVGELYPSWVHAPFGALAQSLMINLPEKSDHPVRAPEPLWCPADRIEFNPGGLSYVYLPWELMAAWPGVNAQRSVSMALERAPDELLFIERSSGIHRGGTVGAIDVKGAAIMRTYP